MDTLLYFLVGSFIANSIPHITNGASGRHFHTPFAKPPGKGFSSPLVNVAWGVANLAVAAFVYHVIIARGAGESIPMGVVSAGFASTLVALAWWFGRVNADNG